MWYVLRRRSRLAPALVVASSVSLARRSVHSVAHGRAVGATWRPAAELRRVSWDQRQSPPRGATGRAWGRPRHDPVDQRECGAPRPGVHPGAASPSDGPMRSGSALSSLSEFPTRHALGVESCGRGFLGEPHILCANRSAVWFTEGPIGIPGGAFVYLSKYPWGFARGARLEEPRPGSPDSILRSRLVVLGGLPGHVRAL